MSQYQTSGYFAQAPGMMEELCEQELIELGATSTKVSYRGVNLNKLQAGGFVETKKLMLLK